MKKLLLSGLFLTFLLPLILNAQENLQNQNQLQIQEQTELNFRDAISKFKNISSEMKKIQSELKNAKKEKKIELQKNLFQIRKDHLIKIIEIYIAHSENLKKRVEFNKAIYGDLELSIIEELNNDITKLTEFKTKINNAQTIEELDQLAKELKSQRKDIYQLKIRRLILLAHIGRFEKAIILNTENRSQRIAEKITQLKNAGKDVTQLEAWLAQANDKIKEAKAALVNLKNNVNSQELNEAKMDEIRKKLNGIKDTIKAVYDLFRQIATTGNSL